eukprot:355089-Prymnesium_polylepis.4
MHAEPDLGVRPRAVECANATSAYGTGPPISSWLELSRVGRVSRWGQPGGHLKTWSRRNSRRGHLKTPHSASFLRRGRLR